MTRRFTLSPLAKAPFTDISVSNFSLSRFADNGRSQLVCRQLVLMLCITWEGIDIHQVILQTDIVARAFCSEGSGA